MATNRWDERFFASTRGQVVVLLRRGRRTVDELAAALDLTDNAVRAHLAGLERDGLVRQGEPRRGGGKPAFTYELTTEADRLFPKAYGSLLRQFLDVVAERLSPAEFEAVTREVGHRLAAGQPTPSGDLPARVERGVALLNDLGGLAEAEDVGAGFVIRGCSCPLAAAVEGHGGACLLAETLLSDVIGAPVRQVCDRGTPPRCRFELRPSRDGELKTGSAIGCGA